MNVTVCVGSESVTGLVSDLIGRVIISDSAWKGISDVLANVFVANLYTGLDYLTEYLDQLGGECIEIGRESERECIVVDVIKCVER